MGKTRRYENAVRREIMARSEIFFTALLRSTAVGALVTAFAIAPVAAQTHEQDSQGKHLDIQSSAGDLHVGADADARKAGLPLYPGARPHHDEENNNANLSLFTEAFGFKLVVAKYDSDDAPAKIVDFYRERLKKYGKVLECHTRKHGGTHADIDDDDKDNSSKELKCEGDNSGPVTELKVGTQSNQHAVSVEPAEGRIGTSFALVYVHAHGKQGDL
jgi:hypothetical protein